MAKFISVSEWAANIAPYVLVTAFAIYLIWAVAFAPPLPQTGIKTPIVWETVDERIVKGCETSTGNLIYKNNNTGDIAILPNGCQKETYE
jgi:hypothetical protein